MPDVEVSKNIAGTVDEVWSVITDLDRTAEAVSGIIRIERLDGGSGFEVGTKWRETRRMFGKEATEEMQVTSLEPMRTYTVLADSHKVHYISTMSVNEASDGTTLSMTFDAEPHGAFTKFMAATVGRLMMGATRKALQKDLDDIAKAVEG
jgi:carbon monoxide dehydrogenase subunit G